MCIELIAIAEAISYLNFFQAEDYVILTGSKSAFQHLIRCTANYNGLPIAYRILVGVNTMKNENKNVRLQWIPSHVRIRGNEVVDRRAREALVDGIHMDWVPYYNDILTVVKEDCRSRWKQYFDERSLSKGIWYKTIQPNLGKSP